jgi:hypothetical protein
MTQIPFLEKHTKTRGFFPVSLLTQGTSSAMATTMENPTTMTTKPNTTHHKDEVPTTMLETTKDTNTVRKLRFQIRLENHPGTCHHDPPV